MSWGAWTFAEGNISGTTQIYNSKKKGGTKMKTIAIISTLILIAVFIGCSDNPINTNMIGHRNISDNQLNQHLSNSQNELNTNSNLTLLWSNPGLSIEAKGERSVYANTDFLNEFDGEHNIRVSYDGWATPDTSCYISSVFISLDNINLQIDIGAQYINGHHEYALGNISGERLRFAVMLWCDDDICNSSAIMKISDIKVYSY